MSFPAGHLGTPEQRYWRKVNKTASCWLWTASTDSHGYGQFMFEPGKLSRASRIAWQLTRGDIPAGLMVLHRCDVPLCVNPEHLFLGTAQDNAQDMHMKGRAVSGLKLCPSKAARGEASGTSKLTEQQVREIRARYVPNGVGSKRLAAEFGVSPDLIRRVVRRKLWRHVD